MTIDRRLTALLFALLVALPATRRARRSMRFRRCPTASPPMSREAPVLPGDQPTVPWTNAEIAAAKTACDASCSKTWRSTTSRCRRSKEGICGTPAPILVKSIGSDPKVAIDPPATMNCALAAGLAKWLKAKVQPEANAVLDTKVVKLHNATSYSCRNRYGGATTPLSEHALANAIDVSDFVFASGDHITVLDGWPRLAASTPSASSSPAPKESRVASVTDPSEGIASSHADLASGRHTRQRDYREDQGQPVRGSEAAARVELRPERQAWSQAFRRRTRMAELEPGRKNNPLSPRFRLTPRAQARPSAREPRPCRQDATACPEAAPQDAAARTDARRAAERLHQGRARRGLRRCSARRSAPPPTRRTRTTSIST